MTATFEPALEPPQAPAREPCQGLDPRAEWDEPAALRGEIMVIDQLVAHAGFTKIDQRIDEWGIFTVSVARRNA